MALFSRGVCDLREKEIRERKRKKRGEKGKEGRGNGCTV